MRILLDECVNLKLRHHLPGHEVRTAQFMGWKGLRNGHLLSQAQHEFDILVTLDGNLPSQQYLSQFTIAVFVLRARSNALADLLPLVPAILAAAEKAVAGTAVEILADDQR